MAHFNFVISQNAKWGHAGFYIDRHRMMTSSKYAYRKVLIYKKSTARADIGGDKNWGCIPSIGVC